MMEKISDAQLSQLSDFVARHLGLHFPKDRWLDLQRSMCRAAQEYGCQDDVNRYTQELLAPALNQRHLQVLASHLTIGETYFFRERRSLEILERHIVPELIQARAGSGRAIRIWSAGCATGEEPYSVAIVLSRLMAGRKNLNVEILATDLNSKSLQKASEGIYGEWSFRGTPAWVRNTYLKATEDDRWVIAPAIKKMVSFVQLNLVDDSHPPLLHCTNGFDVIFCRNVLMYFTSEAMRKVIHRFYCSLAADGWLIVSPTETSQELFSEFASVSLGDITLYRKSAKPLPKMFGWPEFEGSRSDVPVAERTMQAVEPTIILSDESNDEANQDAPDNAACSKSTASPAISYKQALALYEQGRYEDLESVIVALLSEGGDHASAMLLLSRAYANQGKLPSALAWCDKAIAADKMAARAHYLRATILQEQGSLPEALLAFRQAVYAEPQFILGHFALGNLASQQGRHQESQKHFENVLLLLARYQPEDIVLESDGLSVGRLREAIGLRTSQGVTATNAWTVMRS